MIPLKGDVPGQSPTLPSTGAPGRNGTVHMQNPHSPGAGIGQEAAAAPAASSAAAPLERQSKVRREHDTPLGLSTMGTGCPGFWELYVPHVEECGGSGPQPLGRSLSSTWATSGGDRLLVYLYALLQPPGELFVGRASAWKALSTSR